QASGAVFDADDDVIEMFEVQYRSDAVRLRFDTIQSAEDMVGGGARAPGRRRHGNHRSTRGGGGRDAAAPGSTIDQVHSARAPATGRGGGPRARIAPRAAR